MNRLYACAVLPVTVARYLSRIVHDAAVLSDTAQGIERRYHGRLTVQPDTFAGCFAALVHEDVFPSDGFVHALTTRNRGTVLRLRYPHDPHQDEFSALQTYIGCIDGKRLLKELIGGDA
ncbi:MAG: hypothetical protein HYY37_00185 [Candidatus Aenigmarchaeota archaeon]|nr:hypothetical protein [Candidatus Aenigmarchaeota archaeon]